MENSRGHVWIGTSNIVVPGNKTTFPGPFQSKSRLHYYGSLFNSVEINSSFYKTPLLKTYTRWAEDVPENFRFTLKLSKEVTHVKDLRYNPDLLEKFMQNAAGVGNKKGCLLIQFPGKISIAHFNQVEEILQALDMQDPGHDWKPAVEFRNADWYITETREMLQEYNASMVLHDIPKARNTELIPSSATVYIRFHGPAGDYRGSYTDNFLEQKAIEIRQWIEEGKEVFAYFNNTIGNAFENAMSLKIILSGYTIDPGFTDSFHVTG